MAIAHAAIISQRVGGVKNAQRLMEKWLRCHTLFRMVIEFGIGIYSVLRDIVRALNII